MRIGNEYDANQYIVIWKNSRPAELTSQNFIIKNDSHATERQVRQLASILEKSRTDVAKFMQMEPPGLLYVYLEDGSEPPHANSKKKGLYFSYNVDFIVGIEAVVHEITHITSDGKGSSLPFIREGTSVYVDESINPMAQNDFPQYGQSTDAWVKLFKEKGRLLPLSDIFEKRSFNWNFRGSIEDTETWQTYIEAGSFVRFIVESRGWDVFWKIQNIRDFKFGFGISLQDLEKEWLENIDRKKISYSRCRDVLRQNNARFRFWCNLIDQ